jgi:uncharacterized protein
VVVLDEFTYLIGGNNAILSILQKVWDELLKNSNIFLILCSSYIGMMESEVIGINAPLYGRRTGSILLTPLELPSIPLFFPNYTPIEQMEAWAVLGGMPYYLNAFSDQIDLFRNIRQHILDVHGLLYSELFFYFARYRPRQYSFE